MQNTKLSTKQARGERNERTAGSAGLTLGLLLTGCAAGERASASEFAPEEGERLVVYTSHKEEVYWPIIQEFEARTGIWVEVEAGGTSELLARLRREADAPAADVMFGGGVDSLEAYQDCFSPLLLCRLGGAGPGHALGGGTVDSLLPPCRW